MTGVLTWRYLTEYTRRPLSLVLLAVVPVIFVALAAGAIADFARILGGEAGRGQLEAATAGWAAAFLAGVAGFFHVTGSRDPDRRLAAAGSNTARVVTARVVSSTVLAAVASAGALLALAVRHDRYEVRGEGPVLAHVAAALIEHGLAPSDLRVKRATLEDVFLRLTSSDRNLS